MSSVQSLTKKLRKTAGRIYDKSRVWDLQAWEKDQLEQALFNNWGEAAIEEDFVAWLQEKQGDGQLPQWPLSSYLKIMDSRLRKKTIIVAEETKSEKNPRIQDIMALAFKLVSRPAPPNKVAELLEHFDADDIKSALREYVDGIEEREWAFAIRSFFIEGGCAAIILARTQRDQDRQKQIQRDAQEKNLIASLVENERRNSEDEDRLRRARDAEPKPTAEDLFGS